MTAESREILALALPAFLALVAEPLFLLVDSAVVGRLGVVPLAGLGGASAVLLTAAGVFVFLAYGTTSVVSRRMGAGREREALESGIAGVWLGLALGAAAAVVVGLLARPLAHGVVSSPAVLAEAVTYLRVSALGLPGMLVALAATGILRGLLDTHTPLVVATVGFGANALLSVLLVLGLGWGIAGAAWGTVVAQTGMGLALTSVVVRAARGQQASLAPHPGRVLAAAIGGVPLVVRTLALRGVILLVVATAATYGDVPLAAHQVTATVWTFLSFALDALAIAAQALVGRSLGAGDVGRTRDAIAVMARWGVRGGIVLGLGLLLLSPVLPALFTEDPQVRRAITAGLVVVALSTPLSGYVFVLDGVLLGAGDNRWLAGSMTVLLALSVPLVLVARALEPHVDDPRLALVVLWLVMAVFMALRGLMLGRRLAGDRWAVTGETR